MERASPVDRPLGFGGSSLVSNVERLERELEELRRRLAESEQAVHGLASGKLHEDDGLFRAIFDAGLDAMLLADDQGNSVDANRSACELFGVARERLLGRNIVELVGPRLLETTIDWPDLLREGHSERLLRLTRGESDARDVDFRATANIVPERHLVVLRDVTERRRADEVRSRLAAIVESWDAAIISTDLEGVITTWNKGAERLYEWRAAEAVGKDVSILIPAELASGEQRVTDHVGARGSVKGGHTRRRRKDGSVVEVALTVAPIRDADAKVIGAAIVARDLTERRKEEAALRSAEEQLRHAHKMEAIGVLAGGVAHDFNNLLSIILSCTTLVLDEMRPEAPFRAGLEDVRRAGERAAALTQQLLAFSRRQMLQPRVLDLGRVVVGTEEMLRRVLGEDVELSVHTAPALGRVHADPSQVEQVLMNLVVNARDAMPSGGRLMIEIVNVDLDAAYAAEHHGVEPGPYVMLAVADTGDGMDAATRERVFEPFFTTKKQGRGTGLGLSTVFGIVKQSQGHISVHSELRKGTRFEVYLPRTDDDAETVAYVRPSRSNLRGSETILLVEDEARVRTVTREILRRHGYDVLEAQNAGEAILTCEQRAGSIHLLVTDVVMPWMSGPELASRLSASRPEMRVLYVSGHAEVSLDHHGVHAAPIAFLQKPITPDALLLEVREVLDSTPDR
jgi:PAS domain S-box-containing protein